MSLFPQVGFSRNASINFRSTSGTVQSQYASSAVAPLTQKPTQLTLLRVHQLNKALKSIQPQRLSHNVSVLPGVAAATVSAAPLNLTSNVATRLMSTEEINTAPTSFQHNGPTWNGSTATASWSGLGSTALASVGGQYDGSDGDGPFTFTVIRGGTHGQNDLRIRAFAADNSVIETIQIYASDPLNKVYQLSNGLEISLGAGDLVRNDFFEVDASVLSTSYTPTNPAWTGSTAQPQIGGAYDGSQGTGDLTFRVIRGGTHGEDNLRLRVYDPNDSLVQTINVGATDPVNQVYTLNNGLEFTLGAGDLVKHETFKVSVDASDPNNYTTNPDWIHSAATATVSGTYDGSNGNGTLRFRILDNGVHGQDDVRVRVYKPGGQTMQTITVGASDPINQSYALANGLSVTFANGNFIKNEEFNIDVAAATEYSTDPNPAMSTAQVQLEGIYDGAQATDTLKFTVTQGGSHSVDDLTLEVRTSDDALLETLSIAATDPLDQKYTLANGLEFSLGAGMLQQDETFTVDVNHQVPTTVNPGLSFDGQGINDPHLEDQFTIVDGNFELNGTSIAVFAADSINSVLDRINNAGLDVTATFDGASDGILLTRDTPGAQHDIVLSADTSGFLAAMKLDTAVSESGQGDENTTLADLEIMSGVTSGSITLNQTSIAFDVYVDSLADILVRIEQLVPDVDANYDSASGLMTISASDETSLTVSDNGTGLLAALQIPEGSWDYVEGVTTKKGAGYSAGDRKETAEALRSLARHFNSLFDDTALSTDDPFLASIRNSLVASVESAFGSSQSGSTSTGTSAVLKTNFGVG
ncbi:MAG: hypothetical protein ACR2NP_02420, partial [Pirellulaceae bacterium]